MAIREMKMYRGVPGKGLKSLRGKLKRGPAIHGNVYGNKGIYLTPHYTLALGYAIGNASLGTVYTVSMKCKNILDCTADITEPYRDKEFHWIDILSFEKKLGAKLPKSFLYERDDNEGRITLQSIPALAIKHGFDAIKIRTDLGIEFLVFNENILKILKREEVRP